MATWPASDQIQSRNWCWLLGGFALLSLLTIGVRPLISPDEGRYATLALHVLQSGDWVTPRLNGFLYFEKPPLVYWAGALAFKWFGINEFAARLWPMLCELGCVAAVGWATARWWGSSAALRAVAIGGSMVLIVGNGQFLDVDVSLNLGLTLTLCGVLNGLSPAVTANQRRRALLLAWLGMALATLSKGPIGIVIPACSLLTYSAVSMLRGRRSELRCLWASLEWARGLPLFLALTLPWFIVVSWRNPGFAEFFFVHEHLMRYLSTVHHREGGIGYFVPVLLLGAMPWTTLLARRAWSDWRGKLKSAPEAGQALVQPSTFLWCWCGFVFVFFSLSGSKLPSYILPMFPALAILAASSWDSNPASLRPHLLAPLAVWAALPMLCLSLPLFFRSRAPTDSLRHLIAVGSGGSVIVALGCLAAWRYAGRSRSNAAIVVLATAHLCATLMLNLGATSYAELKSAKSYAALIAAAVPRSAPVYEIQMHDQTLPFYLGRDVQLVDYVDEFEFGERMQPGRIVPSIKAFTELWKGLPASAAVMTPTTYERLVANGLPMHALFRDARRVVVTRGPQ